MFSSGFLILNNFFIENSRELIFFVFFTISLIISITDIKYLHISLVLVYIGIIILLMYYFFLDFILFINHFTGGICLALIFILARVLTRGGLGKGDIHYSLLCGLFSGIPGFILSALVASLLGIFFFIFIHIFYKRQICDFRIPFIPFMSLGTLLSFFIPVDFIQTLI